jgi:hypothetical protein
MCPEREHLRQCELCHAFDPVKIPQLQRESGLALPLGGKWLQRANHWEWIL